MMKQAPSFNITEEGEHYNVFIRTINIMGDRDTTSSDDDASLTLKLSGSDLKTIDSEDIDSFSCTIFTKYPNAWISYFKKKAEDSGLKYDIKCETDKSKSDSIVYFKFYTSDGNHHFRFHINESFIKAELGAGNNLDYPVLEKANFPLQTSAATSSEGYVPLSVQFNDSSENATKWIWDFEDSKIIHITRTQHILTIKQEITM